jgi:hypothetical protein
LWDLSAHKIITRRDIVFDESPLIKSYALEVEVKQEQVTQHQEIWLETQPSTKTREQEEASKEEEDVETSQPITRRYT